MLRLVTGFSGQTLSISNWQRSPFNIHRLSVDAIRVRLNSGYSLEEALALPARMTRKFRHPDRDVKRIAQHPALTRRMLARITGRTVRELGVLLGD
jgi:hypothetical protein